MKVSVIVINYNRGDLTANCINALGDQSFRDFEIILVDNGSTDNSLEGIRDFLGKKHLPQPLQIISLRANSGFAGGNLSGFAKAQGEYIALLNNDAEPDRSWLGELVRAMEADLEVGIAATKMIVYGTDIIDSAGDGFAMNLKGFKRGEGADKAQYNAEAPVFGACAGAALYRKTMLEEIGFFDQDFFLIHEDTDLNMRAQLAGWKVMYVPDAVVYHKVRSTISHMSDDAVYYTLRNSELVRLKNIPFLVFLRCLPEFLVAEVADFFYFAVMHRRLKLYLRAKIDVLRSLKKTLLKRNTIMQNKKVDLSYILALMTPVWQKDFIIAKMKKFIKG
jgi:GT2 family glycosyltransferase